MLANSHMWPQFDLQPPQGAAQPDVILWLSEHAPHIAEADFTRDLVAAEMERITNLTLAKVRQEFATARALQRHAVAQATGIAPCDLVFTKGSLGKPLHTNCFFNITHCKGLVALAIARSELGIDAEPLDRGPQVLPLAARVFTPTERRSIFALPLHERAGAALELWTLKEAVMKASGRGLTLEPAAFELERRGTEIIPVSQSEDLTGPWRTFLIHLDGEHALALCLHESLGPTPSVAIKRFPTPYRLGK